MRGSANNLMRVERVKWNENYMQEREACSEVPTRPIRCNSRFTQTDAAAHLHAEKSHGCRSVGHSVTRVIRGRTCP